MDTPRLRAYADLLEIRRKAARRNSTITGVVLILGLAAFFVLGMLGELTGLGLYVAAAILLAFGFAFISTRTRLETIAGLLELTNHLIQNNRI